MVSFPDSSCLLASGVMCTFSPFRAGQVVLGGGGALGMNYFLGRIALYRLGFAMHPSS